MYIIALLLIFVVAADLADVKINEKNFPESTFRVVVAEYDTDEDGILDAWM